MTGVLCQFLNFEFLRSKNSAWLLYTAIRGGGGTEAAGYPPSDVCTLTVQDVQLAYKLELTSIQGRMLVSDWHRIGELKATPKTAVF